jgi:hypothetical protein
MEFDIGVSATLGMERSDVTPEEANPSLSNWKSNYGGVLPTPAEFGGGLVDYLNVHYTQPWGNNPSRSKSANLRFLEVGNEWEGGYYLKKMDPPVPNHAELYSISFRKYYNSITTIDPSVKLMGPTTMKTAIDGLLKQFMQSDGDKVDILSTHRYDNSPEAYQKDIKILHSHIRLYGRDNNRRSADDIKIAYTEYNSHTPATEWDHALWHARVFSYFIEGGVYLSTVWHVNMGSEHTIYQYDNGVLLAMPVHYSLKFFHDHIDFAGHPKVTRCYTRSKQLQMVAVEMIDKIVLFVTNPSDTGEKIDISFMNANFAATGTIDTMTEGSNGVWAIGVVNSQAASLVNGKISYTFPAKSINAVTIDKE